MGDLSLAQRAIAPALNFLVERFFPRGIFYGKDYMKIFDEQKWENMGPTGSAAFFVSSNLRESNATEGEFTFKGVTSGGEPVGDWRMYVEKMETNDKEPE